jgi:pyruvate ferredoxin oxidoreductase alpha subunit
MQKAQYIIPLSGNYAVAYAVKQADVDVIAIYPITPATAVAEKLSEYVQKGELNAKVIPVESEHSAMSSSAAAAACGARAFTSTCSQGLMLMAEVLYATSGLRLPVVMAVANRALSAPLNIWNDQSDAMAVRDANWIMLFSDSVQETYDDVIQAFRIAEDVRVRLPVMVNYDGFILSHSYTPVSVLNDEDVKKFLPRVEPPFKLDPDNPVTIGGVGIPEYYFETKYQTVKALEDSMPIIREVKKMFEELSGRSAPIVRDYQITHADYVLIGLGSINGTVRTVIKEEGKEKGWGSISIRVFRPFPEEELVPLLEDVKAIGVIDKAFSPGAYLGPLATDITSLLYRAGMDLPVINFITGIGGRDVSMDHVKLMFEELEEASRRLPEVKVKCIGLRG